MSRETLLGQCKGVKTVGSSNNITENMHRGVNAAMTGTYLAVHVNQYQTGWGYTTMVLMLPCVMCFAALHTNVIACLLTSFTVATTFTFIKKKHTHTKYIFLIM